jgi:Tol biopolymer transport system component
MKGIIAVGKVVGGLALVVIVLFAISKLIPQPEQTLRPAAQDIIYPPPETTPSARTSTPVPYQPPIRPELTTATPTWDKTSRPRGWPTQLPWPLPSPSTPIPVPTQTPGIFPTPAFPTTPEGKRPDTLQELLYVYAADSNAHPILQTELIDSSAHRWGKGQLTINVELKQGYPGHALNSLSRSPDGKWMIASTAYGVSLQAYLVNLADRSVKQILPGGNVQLLSWTPDSQKVIALKDANNRWDIGEVDLASGKYTPLEFAKNRGDLPVVEAIAFSPDGKYMADALIYPPNAQEGKDYLLNIGIENIKGQERKTVYEIHSPNEISVSTLVWSSDGQSLYWTSYQRILTDPAINQTYPFQSTLWISNRITGEAKPIVEYKGYALPLLSPNGKRTAVVIQDTTEAGNYTENIYLINPNGGTKTQVSHFQNLHLTHLKWSSDSQWIFCNASNALSGTIWAVNTDSGESFPVAGPVIKYSPFIILP